jgi:hypothetical protein
MLLQDIAIIADLLKQEGIEIPKFEVAPSDEQVVEQNAESIAKIMVFLHQAQLLQDNNLKSLIQHAKNASSLLDGIKEVFFKTKILPDQNCFDCLLKADAKDIISLLIKVR